GGGLGGGGKWGGQAGIEGALIRLRPILMTTFAALLGLLPMALGVERGSEANVPLARAVVGGLAASTALTIFVVPSLYAWFHRTRPHRGAEPRSPLEAEAAA